MEEVSILFLRTLDTLLQKEEATKALKKGRRQLSWQNRVLEVVVVAVFK